MYIIRLVAMLLICTVLGTLGARAQISDDVVKIGVLADETGVGAAASGPPAVTAAKLAAEDFGGKVAGKPIEVIEADFAEKPDLASSIARTWFDTDKVDAIADMPVSSAALAVQEIARAKKKTVLVAGAVTATLTGKACSPYSTHWADDSYVLGSAVAEGMMQGKSDTWFFVAVDYALGASLQRDATDAIERLGGKVVGGVRFPLGAGDFASFLLQAQASKAKIIGLASVGQDTVNAVKQVHEFGLRASGQSLAAFLVFITDIHAIGLRVRKASMSPRASTGTRTSRAGALPSGCSSATTACPQRSKPRCMLRSPTI
jgi:branched-chain amino acid transport system substrate-binding protein